MLIKSKRGWELPERAATPETVFHDRRRIAKALAAGPILLAAAPVVGGARAATIAADPTTGLYPVDRNPRYTHDGATTPEKDATTYNNYYEFGSHKQIWPTAQKLPIRPWTVTIDGMVEREMQIGIDDLLKRVTLEERLYRHRCVEAWAMVVPWSGFAMRELVALARPRAGARYVQMETVQDKGTMPGLRQFWYPWPYTEGLTIEEATHELAFLVTGMYGKPVPPQNGAPLRLAVPWKYGFKSVKSIVRFTFTDRRPETFWEALQPSEYGFWANVNPAFDHPRWSQATHWLLGEDRNQRVPTLIYNGYGEFVAALYSNMEQDRKLFM